MRRRRGALPLTPPHVRRLHWPLPDPAKARGSDEEVLAVFRRVRDEIRARVAALAATCLVLFLVGRGLNLPGIDPTPWTPQSDPLWSVFSLVSVNKYPPSPAYVLMTLGLALALVLLFDGVRSRALRPLLTFGRTPLFTYMLHVWIAHGLAVSIGVALGFPASAFLNTITDPSRLIELGWGFGLPEVYAAWACVLILLYPLSRWLEEIKRRRRDWWLGYL